MPESPDRSTRESSRKLVAFVRERFAEMADPQKAVPMAAYMRTSQPFYGVPHAGIDAIAREVLAQFPVVSRTDYEWYVLALWRLPHREEQYLAVRYARQKKLISYESLPLYEQLIREGAWWDFVDEIAAHLVGTALDKDRSRVEPVLDRWIEDRDFWMRRAALLAQLRHGRHTNQEQLFRYCLLLCGEREFFLRKAVGWALREYSKSSPEAVVNFVETHRARLSPLTVREAVRHLIRQGEIGSGVCEDASVRLSLE
ncbi:MAG TPA: DNA alkylation repair protein [Acidobacteriaceae bacterium]